MTPQTQVVPTSEECVQASIELLREAQALERGPGGMGSSARAQAAVLLAKAQVWATLATAPQPLEAIASAALDSFHIGNTTAPVVPIPKLMCPHGLQAKIVTSVDDPDAARYTWQPDCTQGCP